jgi:hypothetical protein
MKITEVAQIFRLTFLHGTSDVSILTRLGYNLAEFYQNSSGHPARYPSAPFSSVADGNDTSMYEPDQAARATTTYEYVNIYPHT